MGYTVITEPAGIKALSEALGWVDVRGYGAVGDGTTDDAGAIQDALDAAAISGKVVYAPEGEYYIETELLPSVSGMQIIGSGKNTIFKLGGSATEIISVIDINNVVLRDFTIDLNDVVGAKGIYLLGAWYTHITNIWSDKSQEAADAYGLYIESGSTTSGHEGSYVNYVENMVCGRVRVTGDTGGTRNATTCTFVNIDCSHVILNNCDAMTFIQPVIQQTGGIHFDLNYAAGVTCIGGDFEGTGIVWNCGTSCRNIKSIGNTLGGFSGTYIAGSPGASSWFMDDYDANNGQLFFGSAQPLAFQNAGWDVKHWLGVHYSGDHFQIGANLKASSATAGDLDDDSNAGMVATLDTVSFKIQSATAGAGSRTLTKVFNLASAWPVYADNTAAKAAGLVDGDVYRTSAGVIMVVYT